MRVVIGPVSADSAQAWLSYARRVVGVLDALAPGECFTTPELRTSFEGYLSAWEDTARRGPEFVWECDIPTERLEYDLHAFHQVATMLARREEATGTVGAPAGSEDFYTAILRGALAALEAEGPASSAFAQHLGEFWPGQQLSIR